MSTPEISPIQTKPTVLSSSEPAIVTFAVNDPEVLLALAEYPEGHARTNFLVTALKVGVLSLKAARGTFRPLVPFTHDKPGSSERPSHVRSCHPSCLGDCG